MKDLLSLPSLESLHEEADSLLTSYSPTEREIIEACEDSLLGRFRPQTEVARRRNAERAGTKAAELARVTGGDPSVAYEVARDAALEKTRARNAQKAGTAISARGFVRVLREKGKL